MKLTRDGSISYCDLRPNEDAEQAIPAALAQARELGVEYVEVYERSDDKTVKPAWRSTWDVRSGQRIKP